MLDEPNDMWAVATVLFELVMSGYPDWTQQHGPLMFGASPADLAAGAKLQDQEEWMAFSVGRIKAAHELWVSLVELTAPWHQSHSEGMPDTDCLSVHMCC